jgi:hypothetical protein
MEDQTNSPSLPNNASDKGNLIERIKRTKEQDWFIKNMIETYGILDWGVIADKFNKNFPGSPRSSKQCYYRWLKHIQPLLVSDSWSDKEDVELLLAHYRFRKNWSDISSVLNGRNRNSVKNRFYSIFRRVKHKIKKSDFSYTSNIDVLQIHYILLVMRNYLAEVTGTEYMTQMTSRDSIYKHLQQLTLEIVNDYAAKFQERTSSYGTIQELFENILIQSEPANTTTRLNLVVNIEIPEDSLEEIGGLVNAKTNDTEPMKTDIEAKSIFYRNESFESKVVEGSSIECTRNHSSNTFSADTTTATKAPGFHSEPEDFGFSEYIEQKYQIALPDSPEITKPAHSPIRAKKLFNFLYPLYTRDSIQ